MNGLDLDAIEARADIATPGPWYADRGLGSFEYRIHLQDGYRALSAEDVDPESAALNAEFIARARTDIPALVARVRELEAVVERVEALATALAEADGEPLTSDGLSGLVAANRYGRMFLSAIEGDRA